MTQRLFFRNLVGINMRLVTKALIEIIPQEM